MMSNLKIGAASAMRFSVTNVAVRHDDAAAFLDVIAARERLAERVGSYYRGSQTRRAQQMAHNIADMAMAASEHLQIDADASDRKLAMAELETAAALAIAAIAQLKGGS